MSGSLYGRYMPIYNGFDPEEAEPPSTIVDLSISNTSSTSVVLSWTSPSDNRQVVSYDIRVSLLPINGLNFSSATQVSNSLVPQIAGSTETISVFDLEQNTQYYFAIKSTDSDSNKSTISNLATATTLQILSNIKSINSATDNNVDIPSAKSLPNIFVPNIEIVTHDSKLMANKSSDTNLNIKNIGTGKITINLKGNVRLGRNNDRANSIDIFDGGANKMAYLKLRASDGTPYFIYVDQLGNLKISQTLPTDNNDGSVIGTQT